MQRHFLDIVPEARIEACVAMYTQDAEEELLSEQPDFVLDAIDDIDTKARAAEHGNKAYALS